MRRQRATLAAIGGAAVLVATISAPAWATYPGDDGRLAFGQTDATGNVDVYTVLPNGHQLTRLTTDSAFDSCPAYSADGRWIAFCSNRTGHYEIWAMDRRGGHEHAITSLGGRALFPDWSPDGRHIVFGGVQGADHNPEIWVVDAATGGNLTALTSCAGAAPGCFNQYPAYSPDGTRIAWIHADARDAGGNLVNEQVWVMNADGSGKTQLTSDAQPHDQLPDWSPDGTRIAYAQGALGSGRIFTMRADGSDRTQLTFGPGDDFGTAWSPDGTRIAFVRDLGGGNRPVEVMRADGSGQHPVLTGIANEFVPAWQPLGGTGD
jgi:Tol biopolymer transport system component